jgi:hypothetical protein
MIKTKVLTAILTGVSLITAVASARDNVRVPCCRACQG